MSNLPFPKASKPLKLTQRAVKKLRPSNQHLIEQERAHAKLLPRKLHSQVPVIERFILDELAVARLAMDIGMENAQDVLERVLDSKVNLTPDHKFLEQAVQEAINLKALRVAARVANLDAEEERVLKTLYFIKASGVGSADERLLSKMLSLFAVPRQEEGTQAPVQQLPQAERPGTRRRTGRPSSGSFWSNAKGLTGK